MPELIRVTLPESALYLALAATDRPFPSRDVARILKPKRSLFSSLTPDQQILADAGRSELLVESALSAIDGITRFYHIQHVFYEQDFPQKIIRFRFGFTDGQLHQVNETANHFLAPPSMVSVIGNRGISLIGIHFGLGLLDIINPGEAQERRIRLQRIAHLGLTNPHKSKRNT